MEQETKHGVDLPLVVDQILEVVLVVEAVCVEARAVLEEEGDEVVVGEHGEDQGRKDHAKR